MTTAGNPIDFYDAEALTAERYSSGKFWERRYHTKRLEILNALLRNDILRQCGSFADVGCGTGEYLSFSQHLVNEVFGVDLSRQYLLRCKSRNPDGLVSADARFLPFVGLAFDCVLCSEVIEHVKDQENLVREVLRVARKFVVFSTPNQGFFRTLVSMTAKTFVARTDSRVGHVSILKFRELVRKFVSDQWKILTAFTIQVFPPTLDGVRLPSFTTPLIRALEVGSNCLFPAWGSISFIVLERGKP